MDRFVLTSNECEILIAFETAQSLEDLAQIIGRDISNISRSLARIASKLPVLEKEGRRWVLTQQGRELVQHTRDSIQYQCSLFQRQSLLRIGTNREFASRILAEHLPHLQNLFPNCQLRISSFETGVEDALLGGALDLGIDCERPFSPDISYKSVLNEPIIAVCSPEFRKKHAKEFKNGKFFSLPHLLCDRLSPDKILHRSDNELNVFASFNDIATARQACQTSVGWALLPRYTVQKELTQGTLVELPSVGAGKSSYGVWWLRGRRYLEPKASQMQHWLKKLEL